MSYIATQRIKIDGKSYATGDPVEWDGDLPEDLKGALMPVGSGEVKSLDPKAELTPEAQASLDALVAAVGAPPPEAQAALDALVVAVGAPPPEAFKKDGEIRADALQGLSEDLGQEIAAEDVAAVRGSEVKSLDPKAEPTPEAQAALDALVAAVDALPPEAFKKDGQIRADALKGLSEELGQEITAEDVAAVRESEE